MLFINKSLKKKTNNRQLSLKFFFLLLSLGWNTFVFTQSNLHFEYYSFLYLLERKKASSRNAESAGIAVFRFKSYNQYILFSNFDKFYNGCVANKYPVIYASSNNFLTSCSFLNWISWGYKFKFFFLLHQHFFQNPIRLVALPKYLTKVFRNKNIFCFFFSPEYHFYAKKLNTSSDIKTGGLVNYTLSPWLLHYPLFGNAGDTRVQASLISYCLSSTSEYQKSIFVLLQNQVFDLKQYNLYKKFGLNKF